MKKVAIIFVLAVFVPSLALAWLAMRSLRDQQFVIERQRSLLYQGVTDTVAKEIADYLAERQREFNAAVETVTAKDPRTTALSFDDHIRREWSYAKVGFSVTLGGDLLCPTTTATRPEARTFFIDNCAFLGNQESAEVYWNGNAFINSRGNVVLNDGRIQNPGNATAPSALYNSGGQKDNLTQNRTSTDNLKGSSANSLRWETRKVNPQQQAEPPVAANSEFGNEFQAISKLMPAEAEFRQLVGDATEGMIARFLQNKLNLMLWHRSEADSQLVFGAQVDLQRVISDLRERLRIDHPLDGEICVAILDDNARPIALTQPPINANWKRPFVATEIGEFLPHWEVAAYLVNPGHLNQAARTARLTLGLLIAVLVLAISIGSWLIISSVNCELRLTRQKTDFVSNVSHELKTPLTSIRMFSELLADGRIHDPAKQRSYLSIITAETARLTRLINNVLDFSRMERGEKKYEFRPCDLAGVAAETAESYRPHLENNGFKLECDTSAGPLPVRGDRDALAQVLVNLLSNAEKYSNGQREITIQLSRRDGPLPCAEVKVLDRGPGVPRGSEEKIFEKFYRAHDSLSSGIQGSGLGLTLARQIARAHGGDVTYESRPNGGSCFALRLPIVPDPPDAT